MAKFLFYCDVGGFGGHEIMALLIMKEMIADDIEIHFACIDKNTRLLGEAGKIDRLQVHRLPFSLNRYNFLTNPLDFPKIGYLRRLLTKIEPDCIVAVQGNIDIASLIHHAAKREKIPVVTYIALAQTMTELGVPWSRLRDAVHRRSFLRPDRFITIGESQKRYLLRHGVPESKIAIVPNVVPCNLSCNLDRLQARDQLGLDRDKTWFGLVGRVFAGHKGHDYLLSAVKAHKERFASIRFLIVGDGPDLDRIKSQVATEELGSFFSFQPWTGAMNTVYSALDAVLMPSNHEGVPLVMIEAVLCGRPVVSSAIDGMKDYLPAEWLFPRGDIDLMTERIISMASTDQTAFCAAVTEQFREVFLRPTIGAEFLRELRAVWGEEPANGVTLSSGAADKGEKPCG